MTDLTMTPCPGPCAAARFEDPVVYGAGAAPESTETERLDRAGPAALASHEFLGLLGVRLDTLALAAAGGLRGLCDDPHDAPHDPAAPHNDRLRIQAILEVHARWMETRLAPLLGAGP